MVLLYHLLQGTFRGGFLGVDLFFTFSGFLTTAVFLDEFAKKKRIDIIGFYRRRFYRILPPVLLTILLITPLALLIRRDFLAGIGTQIAAAVGFVTNYYEISLGGSYENQFVPHLLLHTWSLAVEFHIYIIWGLVLWGMSRLMKNKEQMRLSIFLLALLFLITTFSRMVIGAIGAINLSEIYYATDTHSFPFFIGALLASVTGLGQTTHIFKDLVKTWTLKGTLLVFSGGFLTLTSLMFLFKFDNKWTYWVGFLLASLATAAMILSARILHEKTSRKEPKIIEFLANISYGIYLFHWPLSIIFGELVGPGLKISLTILFSLIFASLSFYVIEPLLMGKQVVVLDVAITFKHVKKGLILSLSPLLLLTFSVLILAPKTGGLETDLMVNGLQQADNKMLQTRTLVDGKQATDYGILEGTLIIGDSVTLRATEGLIANVPEIVVDGEVSRNLGGAYDTLVSTIKNGSLPQHVIIAAGANPTANYVEQLDNIIAALPQGCRLVLVTPYDGREAGNASAIVNQIREYELSLAEQHDWITIADWYQVALDNPQIWQNTDYVHFGQNSAEIIEGQTLYGQMISGALAQSETQSVKRGGNAS